MGENFNKFFETNEKLLKGVENMMNLDYSGYDATEKEVVFEIDRVKLYRYKPKVAKPNAVPTMIVYALVNRYYMMDIQQDRSFIGNLLEGGQDLYLIDWGFPTKDMQYLRMEDYINVYMDACMNFILEEHKIKKANIMGICQGGTFSLIYSALHPEKINAIVSLVTPLDFSTNDGLLFRWGKDLPIEKIVEAYGNVPGDFMNLGFLMLKPFDLAIDKYVKVAQDIDDPQKMVNFMRMEKWIFDSPAQVGATLVQFVNDMYKENKLYKGTFELDGEVVDLKKITAPILVILGLKDNQVPPAATRPIIDAVGSKDKELVEYDTGHIGLFVSGKSQREVAPKVVSFLNQY
ncbi:MAG: class III poly(R)-hydroxyalkanoic acid synthase subunit PhaC [Tissierellia bacterium]|nr:class III poly(R)-hydroxyalkanoic acid synthase subunit PhaC [Tissierellia bacterium]